MAQSICPKCEHSRFEMKENSPSGSAYKYMFIQCGSCGCVVGVTEYFNISYMVKKLLDKFNII